MSDNGGLRSPKQTRVPAAAGTNGENGPNTDDLN
jgi:hypothetical protein